MITANERLATEQQLKDLAIVGREARDRYEALHENFIKLKAEHAAANNRCALAHAALSDHVAAPLEDETFPTEAEQAEWQATRDQLQRDWQTEIEARNLLAANLEDTRLDAVKASQALERLLWSQRGLRMRLHPDDSGVASIG